MNSSAAREIEVLLETSARIGQEPLLVQAASGNTSIKIDGSLWIKASGKWLAHAGYEDILIPVDLVTTRRRISQNVDPAGESVVVNGKTLGTSVETAMHAVLPHRVVMHVHSVNTIAWAVRAEGASAIAPKLVGMEWAWISYVPSGLALARAVSAAMASNPLANVLILANHGLVVCGETCEAAEALLTEVECRLAVVPRISAEPSIVLLQNLASAAKGWRVPRSSVLHASAIDPVSLRIMRGGTLYPCQAIFLTASPRSFRASVDPAQLRGLADPFVLIEGAGMLIQENLNTAATATLEGLSQVLRRIPASAQIQFLNEADVRDLVCADVYHYRQRVEGNSTVPFGAFPVQASRAAAAPFQAA